MAHYNFQALLLVIAQLKLSSTPGSQACSHIFVVYKTNLAIRINFSALRLAAVMVESSQNY